MQLLLAVVASTVVPSYSARAQTVSRFDLTQSGAVAEWSPTHDIRSMLSTPEGLKIEISGDDPYILGPARNYSASQPLWVRVRMYSQQGGVAQLFYYKEAPNETDSVQFPIRSAVWEEVRLPLPPLGASTHLRLDPPGTSGTCVVAFLALEKRNPLPQPTWPRPEAPKREIGSPSITSGRVKITHSRSNLGAFNVYVDDSLMATGLTCGQIGTLHNGTLHWTRLDLAKTCETRVIAQPGIIRAISVVRETNQTIWTIEQSFRALPNEDAFDVTSSFKVDQTSSVAFLPMFTLLPGLGSFRSDRNQGLLCGVEYLDKPDASSSTADLVGPRAERQVPDGAKLTIPLMAIEANGRYVGLSWDMSKQISALFDTPDRTFHSGANLMGLIFPGSNGDDREEGQLLPYKTVTMRAGAAVTLRCKVLGGRGQSVVPAIQQYVQLNGLPALPTDVWTLPKYLRLAEAGWLNSGIRDGSLFRHTASHTTKGQFAPDAAALMLWLSARDSKPIMKKRLEEAAVSAIAATPSTEYNFAGMTHFHSPVAALIWGHVEENAARMETVARETLKLFTPEGTLLYHPQPNGIDLGQTHFANHANGLTALTVNGILEQATWSGDKTIIGAALDHLRELNQYVGTVPRGAQTWEVPLHTPDILASALLIRAYVVGYEITGDKQFLEHATYWAWTGVPFVYLTNPVGEAIGTYATIPVFGATEWHNPVWMGLPVQWCGLIYADSLYRLNNHDSRGPWKRIADGITISGMQQSWPVGSDGFRQGLLPDSFTLRLKIRNDPSINPGTLEVPAIHLFGGPPIYGFHAFRKSGIFVHAPGEITQSSESEKGIAFSIHPWPPGPYHILVSGLKSPGPLRVTPSTALCQVGTAVAGRLVLELKGSCRIEIGN